MTTARRLLIDRTRPTWVHCTSRCVRRAFLAGDRYEHRKAWIEERLQYLARCFAAEVAGYAVMSNHVHVIVRLDHAVAMTWTWSDPEVRLHQGPGDVQRHRRRGGRSTPVL